MRALEFLQDDVGVLSMTRLLMAGSFIVASAIMLTLTAQGKFNESYFGMFLGTFAGSYLVGKNIDKKATPNVTAKTESGDVNVEQAS